jgi:ferredoxin
MKKMIYLKNVTTLQVWEDKCLGCGVCLSVCPREVLRLDNGTVKIAERDACIECGACAQNCPAGAITVKAGVGCAHAMINAALGRTNGACCCTIEPKNQEKEASGKPGKTCC